MRIWMQRMLAAVLVMSLLLGGSVAHATEPEQQTEATEVATQPPAEESAEVPDEPHVYTVDTESEVYQICQEMSKEMDYDQILVYDATADEILYSESREGTKLYPASVTKLFSSYVALQYLDPLDVVIAGDELALVHKGSSLAYIDVGNALHVQTLIAGMMLPSGNDAAIILAAAAGRKIAEDETISAEEAIETFVNEMNRKARELGFERTHFSNPDGWHTGSHYTCLNDMARIAKLALENKTIARYMRLGKAEVTFFSGQKKEWVNTNLIVNEEEPFYRHNAVGMKTGYTRQAEYCVMTAFRCGDGRDLVIGVFGYADTYKRFNDVNKLSAACVKQINEQAKEAGKKGNN